MSWERKPLETVADFCLGKMLDRRKNKGDLLPYLANVNVRWGGFDLDDLREMRFEHHELERYSLKNGDIVMCEGGEPGRCALWKGQRPNMMTQKAVHRIRPRECLNNEFLFYSLLYKGRTGQLAPLFTGTTIKHLPREKLAKVEVEIPPLQVQHRIASILSAYDDLIETTGTGFSCWNRRHDCSTRNGSSASASPTTSTLRSPTVSRRGGRGRRLEI